MAGSAAPSAREAAQRRTRKPLIVVTVAVAYLLLAWAAVLVVDVAGVGQDRLVEAAPRRPLLWISLFEDGSPTELLQWTAIAALTLVSAGLAGRLAARGEALPARFWRLIAVGGALMLLEDAGNVRHRLAHYADLLGIVEEWPYHLAVEAVWFAAIVAVFAVAVLRDGRHIGASRRALGYALGGTLAYGLAVTGSVTRDIGWWYAELGRFVQERVLRAEFPIPEGWTQGQVNFFIVDYALEESLELIGAALLLAAAVAYREELSGD